MILVCPRLTSARDRYRNKATMTISLVNIGTHNAGAGGPLLENRNGDQASRWHTAGRDGYGKSCGRRHRFGGQYLFNKLSVKLNGSASVYDL
jgi:hypothetical protein